MRATSPAFVKMHGLGNDFIIFDFVRASLPVEADWHAAARKLCDRRTGVGADGLVLVVPSDRATVGMRIFNSDGSEAQMCGNAARCVALYACDQGLAGQGAISVEARGATVRAEVVREGKAAGQVRVDMGPPEFRPDRIPVVAEGDEVVGERRRLLAGEFEITCVSMGNPHCVIFVADVGSVDLDRLGPSIERDPAFPDRTNVEFVEIKDEGEMCVRVWERGAGATLACGTGACASLVAAARRGLATRAAAVRLPGGALLVEWDEGSGHVFMTGPAVRVFAGKLDRHGEWFR